jgi:carbamoyl-phosphate synthase large subunit
MKKPKKILVLGSGALRIGQAGEFDYSGTQAIKAFKEEGIRTILVNPNIATVQTSAGVADRVYFLPVTPEYVTRIIEKEKPDAIALSFGGQTALNCGVALHDSGILKKYGVRVLGTPVSAIKDTEDRKRFVERLDEIGIPTPRSATASSVARARTCARAIGYPVMLRAAYALGGRGSGLCRDEAELTMRAEEALARQSVSVGGPQVLIEEWLGGWKEIEYEVVRDSTGSSVTVCNMENLDPLGIHTGESIVVAPSQTLSNFEYHMLREASLKVIAHLGVIGECNIQYALDPGSREYRVIEVNARLSRSSALASKATGYPLAYVAAKIIVGKKMTEITNAITKKTSAFFEPALDYCVVKVPRWDLGKFKGADRHLGSEMKSVGEVMGIGRTFEEALQKALRMVDIGASGITGHPFVFPQGTLPKALTEPTDRRIFAVAEALKAGMASETVHELTKIDRWFIDKILNIVRCEKELARHRPRFGGRAQDKELLARAKRLGFSDGCIAALSHLTPEAVRAARKSLGILPVIKEIDTLAGEFPAATAYLYLTYNGSENDVMPLAKKKERSVLILGSGTYRIGSSVEFDWSAVQAAETTRALGRKTIMQNCNPETVSTDYDMVDRLYFEELSPERVLDITDFEKPEGTIVSMGGQGPNSLALPLHKAGVTLLGTSAENIDRAEDRQKFSKLLDTLKISQPEWRQLKTLADAKIFAQRVGYPVLVRPSYVLSGAAMNVVRDEASLAAFLTEATTVGPDHPVVITKFVEPAKEIEIDAVANKGVVLCYAIGEHIENAGIHSGDATIVLPAQRLYIDTIRQVKKVSREIAHELQITGPFNIQFLAHSNKVQVIETNLRASRSFPFCSKVYRENMIALATRAILGEKVAPVSKSLFDIDYVGVKAAQFSFARLKGADPRLGVEMASTGEVACFGTSAAEALIDAMAAVDIKKPKRGVLFSVGPLAAKAEALSIAESFKNLNIPIYGTAGTATFLTEAGVETKPLIVDGMPERELKNIDFIINIPTHTRANGKSIAHKKTTGETLRRYAAERNIPILTNLELAKAYASALESTKGRPTTPMAWDEFE